MVDQATVGQPTVASLPVGSVVSLRAGQLGDTITSDLHGKYYESNYRGSMYFGSGQDTVLTAVNAVSTTGVTARPIIGVWNPTTSPVNMELLKATVNITTIVATNVNPLGLQWVGSVGNGAISTGSLPLNAKTLAASGSYGKFFHVGTALTGLTTALSVLRLAEIGTPNAAGNATAVTLMQGVMTEYVEGNLIAVPGAVLGIMAGTDTSANSMKCAASIIWNEVPV